MTDIFLSFIPLIILTIIQAVPCYFILGKAGMSRLWLLLVLFPFFGFIALLFVIAFSKWPNITDPVEVFE